MIEYFPRKVVISDGSGSQNRIFGYIHHTRNQQKMSLRQVEHGFSASFFAKFLAYLMILPTLKIIRYVTKFAKKEENTYSTCLNPIYPQHFRNLRNLQPGFWVPNPTVIIYWRFFSFFLVTTDRIFAVKTEWNSISYSILILKVVHDWTLKFDSMNVIFKLEIPVVHYRKNLLK